MVAAQQVEQRTSYPRLLGNKSILATLSQAFFGYFLWLYSCDLTRSRELCTHNALATTLSSLIITTVIISFMPSYLCQPTQSQSPQKVEDSVSKTPFRSTLGSFGFAPMGPSGAHRKYKAQRDSHKTQAGRYVAHSGAAYKVQAQSHQSEPTLVPNLRGFAWPQAQEPQGCWLLDFQLSRWILLVTNDISGGGSRFM